MEPIEREKYLINRYYPNLISGTEGYKKQEPFIGGAAFWEEFWDEQIASYEKRISEAIVRLAALEQAQRDSYSTSKAIDKKLGIANE